MKVRFLTLFTIAALLGCCVWSPVAAQAEELQITDYLGLIRAQRNVQQKSSVRITVLTNPRIGSENGEGVPLLTQRTGFSGDIEAVKSGPDQYVFKGVSPGTWRIRLRNKSLLLGGVEILGEDGTVSESILPTDAVPTPLYTAHE